MAADSLHQAVKERANSVRDLDKYRGRFYQLLNHRGEPTVKWFEVKGIRGRYCPHAKAYTNGWVSLNTACGPDKIGLPTFLTAIQSGSIREVAYAPGSVTVN